MIGGNITAVLQAQSAVVINMIAEKTSKWTDTHRLCGWLDLSSGDSKYTYDAKLQESTHIFICDYVAIDKDTNNQRLVINDKVYDILLIDDPMELHQQLEIYLKYVG